jgi:hypothetical protein
VGSFRVGASSPLLPVDGFRRGQLRQEADNWTRVAGAIGKVLELA